MPCHLIFTVVILKIIMLNSWTQVVDQKIISLVEQGMTVWIHRGTLNFLVAMETI